MKRDLHHNVDMKVGLNIQEIASNTTTVGNIIDTQGYESLEMFFVTGTVTDGDYALLLEEGDAANLSDAAAVADADLLGTEAGASWTADTDDNKISKIGYLGKKRYVRASVVSTNVTNGAFLGIAAVLSHAMKSGLTTQKA